jgi:ABC-type multidrug transport system ATPase subunit
MVSIDLTAVGKRYKWEWIFKNIDLQFAQGQHYAVAGKNGAGKSTFLQLLAGYLSPTRGNVALSFDGKTLDREQAYAHIAMAAPYAALIEDFTLQEAIAFQEKFKKWSPNTDKNTVAEILDFNAQNLNKPLKYFSSGMRQRVKLALAVLSDAPLLLLDEPTITLDTQGMNWFYTLLDKYRFCRNDQGHATERTVIVASNVESDFTTCRHRIDLMQYK